MAEWQPERPCFSILQKENFQKQALQERTGGALCTPPRVDVSPSPKQAVLYRLYCPPNKTSLSLRMTGSQRRQPAALVFLIAVVAGRRSRAR